MTPKPLFLAEYITALQMNGRYTFTREEALTALGISPNAFKLAALRLIKKKQLMRPKKGFYVIVPTEYQGVGAPPTAWYVDSLMKDGKQNYYVGLLSAAALYGAAHQQPQIFQVVTNKVLRSITAGHSRLQFLMKKNITTATFQLVKTPTGYMNISTPEMTAIDLVHYVKPAGYLNNIVTVLSELQESLDLNRLKLLLESENIELSYLQRLGYLLEKVEANQDIITLLKNWIKKHNVRFTPLRTDKNYANTPKNTDWHLYLNEEIESDI